MSTNPQIRTSDEALWLSQLPGLSGIWAEKKIKTAVIAGSLLLISIVLFGYVQFGTEGLVGTDGYYHAKMGLLIRTEGLKPSFTWLPQTILNESDFYDHHLLYHLYLSLFSITDPAVDGGEALTQGAKTASILMPVLVVLMIWWLLRGQGIRWAALWALALFALSEAFLYRMSMLRAQSASLLFLLIGVHLLITERYRWLMPLGFAYVWLYNAFPLLVVFGLTYLVVILVTERRLVWQAAAFPLGGVLIGLILNPYFPENISFIFNHLLPKIGDSTIRVGNEWYPYKTWTLVENSGFALAAVTLGVMAMAWRKKRASNAVIFAFSLLVLFGFMLLKSRRFVEYFPAFALLFVALSVGPLLGEWFNSKNGRKWLLAIPMLLLLLLATGRTLDNARNAVGRSKPADQYADASKWLKTNTEQGSLIFQTDWDDFPRLFFYNTNNLYLAGLDPTYMELFDSDLYDEWVSITKGEVRDPSRPIRERFGATHVLSDLKHKNFLKEAEADPQLADVYRDDYAVIFAVEE